MHSRNCVHMHGYSRGWGVLTRCTLPASPCLVLLQVGLGALARLRACQSAQQPLAAAYSLWLCYSVPALRPEFLLILKSSSTYSWVGLATSSVHVCLAVALHSCARVCGKCLGCPAAPGYSGVCTHWQHGYWAAWPWGRTWVWWASGFRCVVIVVMCACGVSACVCAVSGFLIYILAEECQCANIMIRCVCVWVCVCVCCVCVVCVCVCV